MKAIVNAEGLERAKRELADVAIKLFETYQKAQGHLASIQQAGWQDAHYEDLKTEFNKANEYILPLRQFMVNSEGYLEKQKELVDRYKNIQLPKLK